MTQYLKSLVAFAIIFSFNNVSAQSLCTVCKDVYETMKTVDEKIASSQAVSDIKIQIGATTQNWKRRADSYPLTCKAGDPSCNQAANKTDGDVVALMKYYLDILDQTSGTANISKQDFLNQISSFKTKTMQDIAKLCGNFTINSACS